MAKWRPSIGRRRCLSFYVVGGGRDPDGGVVPDVGGDRPNERRQRDQDPSHYRLPFVTNRRDLPNRGRRFQRPRLVGGGQAVDLESFGAARNGVEEYPDKYGTEGRQRAVRGEAWWQER